MANRITKRLAFLIVLSAMGCSSSPQSSNYYLLESPAGKPIVNSEQRIILHPIELSDYLKSSNLHVKSSSGQITYSATDVWAEQPAKLFWRAIKQSLESQTGHHVLTSYDATDSCAKIKVRIDELSPSPAGEVITTGRWFIDREGRKPETRQFSFSGHISTDGYEASNKIIAGHLHELATELENQIRDLNLCQNGSL